jgi:hypothetical protein
VTKLSNRCLMKHQLEHIYFNHSISKCMKALCHSGCVSSLTRLLYLNHRQILIKLRTNIPLEITPPLQSWCSVWLRNNSYSKGKAVPLHTMEAQEERRYSSYSFSTSALDGVSGQCHVPAALYPRGDDPWYPLCRRLGGPQSRSGHRG